MSTKWRNNGQNRPRKFLPENKKMDHFRPKKIDQKTREQKIEKNENRRFCSNSVFDHFFQNLFFLAVSMIGHTAYKK